MNTLPELESVRTMDRWNRSNRYTYIMIGVIGLVVIAIVTYGFYKGIRIYKTYFPLVFASMEIRIEAISANLALEEIINGNQSKNEKEVWTYFERAEWYANAMLNGAKGKNFELQPIADQRIRESIQDLTDKLRLQKNLSKKRLQIRKKKRTMYIRTQHYIRLEIIIFIFVIFEIF